MFTQKQAKNHANTSFLFPGPSLPKKSSVLFPYPTGKLILRGVKFNKKTRQLDASISSDVWHQPNLEIVNLHCIISDAHRRLLASAVECHWRFYWKKWPCYIKHFWENAPTNSISLWLGVFYDFLIAPPPRLLEWIPPAPVFEKHKLTCFAFPVCIPQTFLQFIFTVWGQCQNSGIPGAIECSPHFLRSIQPKAYGLGPA